jgi:hypothetical protein
MISNQRRVCTQLLTSALAGSMLEGEVDKGVAAVTNQISGTYLAAIRTEAQQQGPSLR